MTTPDLDARVAAIRYDLEREVKAGDSLAGAFSIAPTSMTELNRRSLILIRDLHAALKAARGEEFEAWAAYDEFAEQPVFVDLSPLSVGGLDFPVRRVLCRLAPDDGDTP